MNLLYREAACHRAAGTGLGVGLDETNLDFELLVGQFEDAVLVDLIADLAKEVRNVIGGSRGAACAGFWLLG